MAAFSTTLIEDHIDADDDYAWDIAYNLAMTATAVQVTVNVRLTGVDPGGLKLTWMNGVQNHWNDKAYYSDGTTLYKINFDFNYVTSGEHQVVQVHSGEGRFDMNNWYLISEGWPQSYQDETAAHEVGHMFGNPDEYEGGATFNHYVTTGTLMSDLTVMDNQTTAGYENYFSSIKHFVEVHGFNESNPNVDTLDVVLATLGDAGNNTLTGNAGMNALLGLAGNDVLSGLNGNDRLEGGTGNDTLVGGFGVNFMDGGAGVDTVDYRFYNGEISVDLTAGTALFPPATEADTLVGIENVLAGNGNDTLIGNAAVNVLDGGGGSDQLEGRKGSDTYLVNVVGDKVIEAASGGTDTVNATATYVLTPGSEIETLRSFNPALANAMNFAGNAFGQTIQGNAGTNVINGIGGADTMSGLGGNDTYYVDINTDKILEANGQGTDKLYTAVSYALAGAASVETMQTTAPTATTAINLIGNAYFNTLLGNNGANLLNGAGGSDTLFGSGGKDWFRLSVAPSSTNIDTIQDFNVADDAIQLENSVFTALSTTPGTHNADAFRVGTNAADAEDRIVYDNNTGGLYYDVDGTGSQSKVLIANLLANLAMTNLDFEIV